MEACRLLLFDLMGRCFEVIKEFHRRHCKCCKGIETKVF